MIEDAFLRDPYSGIHSKANLVEPSQVLTPSTVLPSKTDIAKSRWSAYLAFGGHPCVGDEFMNNV